MKNKEFSYFHAELSIIDAKVFSRTADDYLKNFLDQEGKEKLHPKFMVEYFATEIQKLFSLLIQLDENHRSFIKAIANTRDSSDKQSEIIAFIQEIDMCSNLKADVKSFKRWFSADAASERYLQKVGRSERNLKYLFTRLAFCSCLYLKVSHKELQDNLLQISEIQTIALTAFYYQGDERVKLFAFAALNQILTSLPRNNRQHVLSDDNQRITYKIAQDKHQSIELQQAALSLVMLFSAEIFSTIAIKRLQPLAGDEMFIRAHITLLLGTVKDSDSQNIGSNELKIMNSMLQTDPSDYVRQTYAGLILRIISTEPLSELLKFINLEKQAKVIGTALLSITDLSNINDQQSLQMQHSFSQFFQLNWDDYALRILLHVIPIITLKHETSIRIRWCKAMCAEIDNLHDKTPHAKVRKWSATCLNHLWIIADERRLQLSQDLKQQLDSMPISRRYKLKMPSYANLSNDDLGRLLTVLTENDFGLDLESKKGKFKVLRWYRFKFRLWRFLYELKNSATDKRQAHYHLIGRVFFGNMSIPSAVLAEQTATKVPGEPLFEPSEDGPRNYLPLVDELISCLDQSWPIQPLNIYSADGITQVTPPNKFFKRFKAKYLLTKNFEQYADARNWTNKQLNSNNYIQMLLSLGFEIEFKAYTDDLSLRKSETHQTISKFFSISGLPLLGVYWDEVKNYYYSIYSNNLQQLAVFLGGLLMLFIGKHAWLNIQANKVKKRIPFVIGGWGTRGKSGTERLKAALFNAMGLSVISKTTGCEAMFLHGIAHQDLKEMFLFRPFDKATIWEQINLFRLADKLHADVFLWECMGLTPAYVRILQRHWMRDDYATITNTYPDHEDVQGPAGYDIPNVMTEFIPRNSHLITSEEVMYPILKHATKDLNTKCHPVTWIETGAITDDIMERFPYEEHPNNIALVTTMAHAMGIEKDFVLRNMADKVVLDLGVLKTYPEAKINHRRLQYIMGNSANERLGAMGNWTRMGLDQHDMEKDAGVWISTVINNRADRVPRSKVFASILVNDISADQHFLIGTNVDGFQKFLHEAWDECYSEFSIWEQGTIKDDVNPIKACNQLASKHRIIFDQKIINNRYQEMLQGLNIEFSGDTGPINKEAIKRDLGDQNKQYVDEITSYIDLWQKELSDYQKIIQQLQQHSPEKSNEIFLEFLYLAFMQRLIVVQDSMATGEEIVQLIAQKTPLGLLNRIMGMQNIKGTGLDFVYRWQAWEACHKSALKLDSKKQSEVTQAIRDLKSFKEFGSLSFEFIEEKIKASQQTKLMQSDMLQAEIQVIKLNLKNQKKQLLKDDNLSNEKKEPKFLIKVVTIIEGIIDVGDAVMRRKKANLIYQDLATHRISHNQAAVELQALTKRQKGGWLWQVYKKHTGK